MQYIFAVNLWTLSMPRTMFTRGVVLTFKDWKLAHASLTRLCESNTDKHMIDCISSIRFNACIGLENIQHVLYLCPRESSLNPKSQNLHIAMFLDFVFSPFTSLLQKRILSTNFPYWSRDIFRDICYNLFWISCIMLGWLHFCDNISNNC